MVSRQAHVHRLAPSGVVAWASALARSLFHRACASPPHRPSSATSAHACSTPATGRPNHPSAPDEESEPFRGESWDHRSPRPVLRDRNKRGEQRSMAVSTTPFSVASPQARGLCVLGDVPRAWVRPHGPGPHLSFLGVQTVRMGPPPRTRGARAFSRARSGTMQPDSAAADMRCATGRRILRTRAGRYGCAHRRRAGLLCGAGLGYRSSGRRRNALCPVRGRIMRKCRSVVNKTSVR